MCGLAPMIRSRSSSCSPVISASATITALTLGVTVGVSAVIVALALMTGLQDELRDRIIGANPHIYVWNQKGIDDYHAEVAKLRQIAHVTGAAPAVVGKALISASKSEEFISITGIDPMLEPSVIDLSTAMLQGSIADVAARGPDDPGGILLGKDLASGLGVSVGDSVTVFTPQGTLSPLGMIPRSRRLRVAGIFSLGLYELDETYGFVSIE